MNDAETLREHIESDHTRGCEGRQYSCKCGYDGRTELLLRMAADRIEKLEATLREIIDRPNLPEREQAESIKTIARAALAQEQDA